MLLALADVPQNRRERRHVQPQGVFVLIGCPGVFAVSTSVYAQEMLTYFQVRTFKLAVV